jgi:hypothetical protein
MRQRNASVRHYEHQISQAQLEAGIPADTQDDDLSVEMPSLEQCFDRAEGCILPSSAIGRVCTKTPSSSQE